MNPNDKQTLPIDYLDQIAPKHHKDNNFFIKKPLFIGIIIAIVISVILITIGGFSNNTKTTSTLAARLKVTNEIAVGASKKIKSSELIAINSDIKIYLTNTIRDITPILAKDGVKVAELNKELLSSEAKPDLIAELEDARLNNIYDRTYSRKMYYQLDSISKLIDSINKSTNSKSLKTFLNNAKTNLTPIQKLLADFYNSNS